MKFKTLVVDDELEAQKRLLFHLGKFEELELLGANQNGKEALETINSKSPDIVFLDVEMPEMNGIDVLANCRPPFPYIIFVTAYNQYAVEAFEQNAVDYILKPYTFERIQRALNKATTLIEKDRLASINENFKDLLFTLSKSNVTNLNTEFIKRIAVKSIGHTTFIPVDDIIYIEAADQYVEVHTEKKKFTVRESMDKLERTLDPRFFFRTHRSSIVNLESVMAIENVDKHISLVILNNKKKVKIANNRKQDFKEKMNF
ncbi:LytR/AlgR family response regulator transcription factor [Allomuricauda sp. SCSIO 65647]|uniref:LytR/AlgR family response regulator transcription factor n=1 Tax=Allomuricauda sp. SCSIO 65647 TaxID=2908843 RepID=UPI001F1A978F|nr:LytTR family DNA-binding domain-containing protein [Muricauda sp. SCSIO 65647]UJH67806.1 LytTR family DNA-binding domain-containing protein [Muricauda sp. SCSIO 65647]